MNYYQRLSAVSACAYNPAANLDKLVQYVANNSQTISSGSLGVTREAVLKDGTTLSTYTTYDRARSGLFVDRPDIKIKTLAGIFYNDNDADGICKNGNEGWNEEYSGKTGSFSSGAFYRDNKSQSLSEKQAQENGNVLVKGLVQRLRL